MFVQIIEGRTTDPDAFVAAGERWVRELKPGATGFLGLTAGVTADGRFIEAVRFDTPESARANSDRPEQGAFWNEVRSLFDGEPTFVESTDTEEFLGGGDDSATFVQVMKSTGTDRVRVKELDAVLERFATERPDLLGVFRVWTAGDTSYEFAYFTTEAAARAGEAKQLSAEMQEAMAQFGDLMANTEFLDLKTLQIV